MLASYSYLWGCISKDGRLEGGPLTSYMYFGTRASYEVSIMHEIHGHFTSYFVPNACFIYGAGPSESARTLPMSVHSAVDPQPCNLTTAYEVRSTQATLSNWPGVPGGAVARSDILQASLNIA